MASNQGLGRHMRPRHAWLWHVRTFNRLKSVILLWFETGLERFIPLYPWPCPSNYIPVAMSLKTSTDEPLSPEMCSKQNNAGASLHSANQPANNLKTTHWARAQQCSGNALFFLSSLPDLNSQNLSPVVQTFKFWHLEICQTCWSRGLGVTNSWTARRTQKRRAAKRAPVLQFRVA